MFLNVGGIKCLYICKWKLFVRHACLIYMLKAQNCNDPNIKDWGR